MGRLNEKLNGCISCLKKRIDVFLSSYSLPHGIVLLIDLIIVWIGYISFYFVRVSLDLAHMNPKILAISVTCMLPIYLLFFVIFKTYTGIIRHTNTQDSITIAKAMIFSTVTIILLTFVLRFFDFGVTGEKMYDEPPVLLLIIHMMIATFLMIAIRYIIKWIYDGIQSTYTSNTRTVIYGAGRLGRITHDILVSNPLSKKKILAFIDDNIAMRKKRYKGVRIYHSFEFENLCKKYSIDEVVIAINKNKISKSKRSQMANMFLESHISVKQIPSTDSWLEGNPTNSNLQNINIEDLLERAAIRLNHDVISRGLKDKIIMVTGAAGSIGSEIVRQLLSYETSKIILVDKAESDLYDLHMEIINDKLQKDTELELYVASVNNAHRMQLVFEMYKPQIVFNAAAYKHVPLMESHPYEAVNTNILGCKILADLSVKFKAEKFVMISTDKAVNPTNVMGASKRACEMYIQALSNENTDTEFITTRFGNVLGSNGSVVPLFKRQIEKGGPLTVTNKDITRYFMTIPEACQLVLEAGFMGQQGEIYVFDMGKPVKIYDLAVKMIKLAGYEPNKDIKIKITGLRPGEKLYEELLATKENTLPTHNKQILIAKVRTYPYEEINNMIIDIIDQSIYIDKKEIVKKLQEIVPEFKPKEDKVKS